MTERHHSDDLAQSLANRSDPADLTPVHLAVLLKAIYRKLDRIEQVLAIDSKVVSGGSL